MQTILQAPVGWIARTGDQIDRIRINALSRDVVAGVPVWVKRRTWLSRLLVPVANRFFWMAGNPIRVLATNPEWQKREISLFRLLNGENRQAGELGGNQVYGEVLPGKDLVKLLENRRLDRTVIRSVGEAFRKMHGIRQITTGDYLSHGDPHLGNVIYDFADESVYWVDFETVHHRELTTNQRRADDLLVFLLDLVGRATETQWQTLGPAFLEAYDEPEVMTELKNRLRPPSGMGAVWWAVRTSYLSREELRRRVAWLRERL